MHYLNFCGTLCLVIGVEGSKAYDCRGIDFAKEFDEGFVFPMAGAAVPLHVLYTVKPVVFNKDDNSVKILQPGEYLTKTGNASRQKLNLLTKDLNTLVVAPDSAVDPNKLCDVVFAERDKHLREVVEALFRSNPKQVLGKDTYSDSIDKVVIWANNGIGKKVTEESRENGVLRDEKGIAYAMMLNGEKLNHYDKGLSDTYQNSAHHHIHIAPTLGDDGFDEALTEALGKIHKMTLPGTTLLEYRKLVADDEDKYSPCIGFCVVTSQTDLSNELKFDFYAASDLTKDAVAQINEGTIKMAGLARSTVVKHSKNALDIDFNDKPTAKACVADTKEFYEKILN